MKLSVKNTIPVYDICALADAKHMHEDITAEGFAHYLMRHPDLHFPHRHSFYHVVYFSKGIGTHSIDFETFDVQPGQIYFMIPGQVHSWNFDGETDGYIINFSEQLLYSFLKEGQYLEQFPFFNGTATDGVIQLTKNKTTIEKLLQEIINEIDTNAVMNTEMIKVHLLSLFIQVLRESVPSIIKPYAAPNQLLLRNFRKLVEQHYHHLKLPKDYAAMLYITPNHLNALCNDIAGKSAGELIRDRVLLEAKRLLVSSGMSVAEIAWQLSFKDNSYFTKFFKKYTNVTPEHFRETPLTTTK